MSVNSKMKAIADAIRNLLDISGTMGLDEMASNISSITKRGAVAGTISTKSEQYIIPAGYHNGNGTVGISSAEQEKLIAENIKNGVTILGVSGTASGDIYAIISVTYPEGSICTCYDDTTTIPARDTSGKALFNVSTGTWTVTATDGSRTTSKTVSITTDGQIESVELSYWNGKLFVDGNEFTDITGGWEDGSNYIVESGFPNRANIEIGTHIIVNAPDGYVSAAKTKKKIDVSQFSTLRFTLVNHDYSANKSRKYCFLTTQDSGTMSNIAAASIDFGSTSIGGEVTLDVSALNGKHYIAFICHNGRYFELNNIRLE